ncbi:hypothetical protein EDC96DRAFT_524552 [Choanephora cucurbitarum]|nr:hypothetical protein EDC96DRAFT_524552 [Choanephora cucurbitarum]
MCHLVLSSFIYLTFEFNSSYSLFCSEIPVQLVFFLPTGTYSASAFAQDTSIVSTIYVTWVVVGSGLQNRNKTFLCRALTVLLLLFGGL